jgi:biopolymer transport protein ExbD
MRADRGWSGELPVVVGVTGAPPASETVAVEMQRDGRLLLDGLRVSGSELLATLAEHAKNLQEPGNRRVGQTPGVSRAQVLLRLHPDLPFEALVRLLQLVCQAEIHRVFYAVRGRQNGPERAIALFIPFAAGSDRENAWWRMGIHIRYALPSISDTLLADRLRHIQRPVEKLSRSNYFELRLNPDMNTRVASLLRIAFAIRRVGFDEITFFPGKPFFPAWDATRSDFVELVARCPAAPASEPGIRIVGPLETFEEFVEVQERK